MFPKPGGEGGPGREQGGGKEKLSSLKIQFGSLCGGCVCAVVWKGFKEGVNPNRGENIFNQAFPRSFEVVGFTCGTGKVHSVGQGLVMGAVLLQLDPTCTQLGLAALLVVVLVMTVMVVLVVMFLVLVVMVLVVLVMVVVVLMVVVVVLVVAAVLVVVVLVVVAVLVVVLVVMMSSALLGPVWLYPPPSGTAAGSLCSRRPFGVLLPHLRRGKHHLGWTFTLEKQRGFSMDVINWQFHEH